MRDLFTTGTQTNWTYVFLVPCMLTVLCATAFLLFFRGKAPAAEAA